MALVYSGGSGGGGGGGVQDVTAGDTSIVVGGSAAHPTVETADLATIAADHATSGDVALNAHKITGLANGSAATDAAAFGQIVGAVLFDQTLGAPAATIDTGANGIAAGYNNLMVVVYARSAGTGTGDAVRFTFNGDTGANYDLVQMRNLSGTVSAPSQFAGNSGIICNVPTSSQTASYFGTGRMLVASYDVVTAGFKATEAAGGYALAAITGSQQQNTINAWRSTAVVNQLAITLGNGGNFVTGSRLTIYGLG